MAAEAPGILALYDISFLLVSLSHARTYIVVEDVVDFKVGGVEVLTLSDALAVFGHQAVLPLSPVGTPVLRQVGGVSVEEVVEVGGEGRFVQLGAGRDGREGSGKKDGFGKHGDGEWYAKKQE